MTYHAKRNSFVVLILIISTFLFSGTAFGQKVNANDVPTKVSETLVQEYPMAKLRDWYIEDNLYVAHVVEDRVRGRVFINSNGEWQLTKFEAPVRELPAVITEYVNKEYPNFSISESSFAQDPKIRNYYFLEVKRSGIGVGQPSTLKFDINGHLVERNDPPGFTIQETATADEVARKRRVATNPDAKEPKERKQKKAKQADIPENLISESSLPELVKRTFTKRFRSAKDPQWFKGKEDTLYTVKCVFRETNTIATFDEDGAWVETRTEMGPKNLFAKVSKFLDEHYRGYNLVYADKIMRADKNNGYSAVIIERKYRKEKYETRLLFDRSGNIFKTFLPEFEDEDEDEGDSSIDRRYRKAYEEDYENISDAGSKMTNREISAKELPGAVSSYVLNNYPGTSIKNSFYIEDEDMGKVYQVRVQREGLNQVATDLYFDVFGNFIRSYDDTGEEIVNEEVTEEISVIKLIVPDPIQNAFKQKYPRITQAEWDEIYGTYEALFIDRNKTTKVGFDESGNILYTSNKILPENLSERIRKYIRKEYGKRNEVKEAWMVRKADRKTYYQATLVDKRTQEETELEFTSSGVLVEQ